MTGSNAFGLSVTVFGEGETKFLFRPPEWAAKRLGPRLSACSLSVASISVRTPTTPSSRVDKDFPELLLKPKQMEQSTCSLPVNRVRVLYFFTGTKSIREFLEGLQVHFMLSRNDSQTLAEGHSLLLRDYDIYKEHEVHADKRSKKILLYTSKQQLVHLEVFPHSSRANRR